MNVDAFYDGMAESLAKDAGLRDWFRSTIIKPFAQGMSDKHYGGLGRYNPQTGEVEENTTNALRAISGAPPITAKPPADSSSWLQRTLYGLGSTKPGKWLGNRFYKNDEEISNALSSSSNGVFSTKGNGVEINRGRLPGLLMNKATDWMSRNKPMVAGGLLLGLGALTMSGFTGGKSNKTPQVAAPAGEAAAPFTGIPNKYTAGRQGSTFTPYQEI